MEFITKDLLINFLLILLPLFLVQMIYLLKYVYRFEKLKESVVAIFPVISVVFCMLFPVVAADGFSWDFRRIPFILGALYGGYRLGFFLLSIILIIRFFIGGDGFYLTLYSFSVMTILMAFLSKPFLKMTVKNKVLITCSMTLLTLMITIFCSEQIFHTNLGINMWMQYLTINIVGMFITTLFWEVIRTNFEVLQKLIKAEKLEVVSHLAASISHEVRNPLTVSRGFLQMLSGDISIGTRKKYVDIALQELDRATDVINDYLTFAKPVNEKNELMRIPEEIQHAVNVITPLANMNGVQVKLLSLLEHDDYFVRGERRKFQQSLINLFKNGIESMSNNGELHIQLRHVSPNIQIDIQDQGTGMTPEQIHRLGEPYFTTKDRGTGLGLMVSYSIIKGMHGNINVVSEQGKGTCFSLVLPVQQNVSNV
jgi:two-component system, sporulation sensor kinase B